MDKRTLRVSPIITALRDRDISQYRIAKVCEVSWNTAHNWAIGLYDPRPDNLNKLKMFFREKFGYDFRGMD